MDVRRSNAHFLPLPGVRLLSSEGFGRIGIALPEDVDVDYESGAELLNEFSIAIATTDVRDCFHRFRMPLSLSSFLPMAVPARVFLMTREILEGQAVGAYCHVAMLESALHGLFLVAVSGPQLQ